MKIFSKMKIKTRLIAAFCVMLLLLLLLAGFAAAQVYEIDTLQLQNPAGTLWALTASALCLGLLMMFIVTNSIVKPIAVLSDAARDVNNGDLNVLLKTTDKDELGELTNAFGRMITTLNLLTDELEYLAVAQSEGVTGVRMEATKYKGTYGELAMLINDMVAEQNQITNTAINTVLAVASGDFAAQAPAFPGDKAILNETIELLRTNIRTVYNEMSKLVQEAAGGRLGSRADAAIFNGGWYELVSELNALMEAVTNPVNETIRVLEKIAAGDLHTRMAGVYRGDFQRIMDCVNFMGEEISGYIAEISTILSSLSGGDFTIAIERDYIGDFTQLKESINTIIANMNKDFSTMQTMASQFSVSANQLSEASTKLAQGATEQTNAVNNLTSIIKDFREVSEYIAHKAKEADGLLGEVDREAQNGNTEMGRLTAAMDDINQSSASIAAINKMIDSIAVQTNLLAINAAIEAARAGEHGRGFGVVAEEVRDLANRSGKAAKETAGVIEQSLVQVTTGTQIADNTAVMLHQVSQRISEILSVVTDIATVSGRQTDRTDQLAHINANTQNIMTVTMETASASQQTAATSEELASQAMVLNETLSRYRLRV